MEPIALLKALEYQAHNNPNAIALTSLGDTLSYSDLNQHSSDIAGYLKQLNVNLDNGIALFISKRIDAVVAIYGILRSGAAYVPLDTQNPKARIQYIAGQCRFPLIITTPDHLETLEAALQGCEHPPEVLVLRSTELQSKELQSRGLASTELTSATLTSAIKDDSTALGRATSEKPNAHNGLAAILYTSGSTGEPKGVMISHKNIEYFVQWSVEYFQLSHDDRCISHAPLHFDLSLFDLFAAHRVGANVVLVPEQYTGNPKFLAQYLSTQAITVWQSVPSVLTLLYKYGDLQSYSYPALRHVLFAGEVMNSAILRGIAGYFTETTFHNVYGATETNDTFVYSIAATANAFPDPLPIGQPLPYVDYLIVNDDPTITSEGELYVKTPTLMQGYKRSQDHPFESSLLADKPLSYEGYYRTKDVVKILPDGNFVFCGRTDDIIKSNGYRINTLEVEAILQGHPDIRDATIIAVADAEIGNRLVAVVSAPDSPKLSGMQLRMYCAERLPKYAIPHFFEIGHTPLPKTSSGKTNKKSILQARNAHV